MSKILEDELVEFAVYETELLIKYDVEMSEFWKQQYELYNSGYTGSQLHDTTLVVMSSLEAESVA